MRIKLLVLTAMLLSPTGAIADRYHHHRAYDRYQNHRGYANQRTCYKEIYREEYVAGTRSSKGYVKSYLDKVQVPCSLISRNRPAHIQPSHHNHFHYFSHNYHRHYKPYNSKFLVSPIDSTNGGSCSSSSATTGGLLGGGLAAAISDKDAYAWSIPLGAVLGMGIANADC